MKLQLTTKLFIAFSFIFILNVLQAQPVVYFTEDFSGNFPPTGWTIDGMVSQWSQKQTANAGGAAPEARLKWVNGNGTTYFISPAVDLTGVNEVVFSFKQYLDDYSGSGYTIGVATRSGTNGTWNTVWSLNPTGDIGPETKSITITGGDVGAANFQVAIFLTGNYYNFDYWYIDDISLFKLANFDLKVNEIDMPNFVGQGNIDISAFVTNLGVTDINSFDISYSIDGGAAVTESVSGVSISSTEIYHYTFTNQWNATSGNHTVEISISNINGGNDDDASDDTLSKGVSVATNTTVNFPLFEEFTSSTCAPCANFNTNTLNPFIANHENDIAVIKYQMNWPSPGDPYYTDEGGVRRAYYGVSGVPTLFVGGFNAVNNLDTVYNEEAAKQTFFEITPTINITGNTVDVDINITSYVDADLKVYTAVVEKKTTGNVGNNGETEFHYVMMKMLPDANGTLVNFTADNTENLSFSQDMSNTNVEEMSDLLVVVLIQDDNSHIVYQSAFDYPGTGAIDNELLANIMVYPNPSKAIFNIQGAEDMQISVFNSLGMKILEKTSAGMEEQLDLSSYPKGVYMLKLSQNDKVATLKIVIAE